MRDSINSLSVVTSLKFDCVTVKETLQNMVVTSLAMQVTAVCDAEDHNGWYLDPLLFKMRSQTG